MAGNPTGSLLSARKLIKSGVNPAVLKRLPALLSALGIIGLLPFWYSQLYVPSRFEPTFHIETELQREGTIDTANGTKMFAIKATTSLKNGGSRLRLVASLYTAIGKKTIPKPEGLSGNGFYDGLKEDGPTYEFATEWGWRVLATDPSFSPVWRFYATKRG